jgi:hypothetical protein
MNYWHRAEREMEGVAYSSPAFPEWTFYVRRRAQWSPHWQRAVERISAQPENAELIETWRAPDYVMTAEDKRADEQMMVQIFAESCIANWDGVTDRDGNVLAPLPANAVQLFRHFPQLYMDLRAFSDDAANFAPISDELKETLARGNLLPASPSSMRAGGSTSRSSRSGKNGATERPIAS